MNNRKIPLVSIIVPTYQREDVLCNTLNDLLKQNYPCYEILVIDQSENHDSTTSDFLETHSNQIRYFRVDKPGLPGARNFGISNAIGDIILFVDDDVELSPDFIWTHVKNYEDQAICGVSGKILQKGIREFDTDQVGQVTFLGRIIGNRTSSIRTHVEWAAGGNDSFRRELALKTGGFDDRFSGNALFEDVDFSFRIRNLGYKILYDPEAVILHLASQRGGCQTRTEDRLIYYYWFIRNKTLFYLKNFPKIRLPLVLMTNFARAIRMGLIEDRKFSSFCYLIKAIWDGYIAYKSPLNIPLSYVD